MTRKPESVGPVICSVVSVGSSRIRRHVDTTSTVVETVNRVMTLVVSSLCGDQFADAARRREWLSALPALCRAQLA